MGGCQCSVSLILSPWPPTRLMLLERIMYKASERAEEKSSRLDRQRSAGWKSGKKEKKANEEAWKISSTRSTPFIFHSTLLARVSLKRRRNHFFFFFSAEPKCFRRFAIPSILWNGSKSLREFRTPIWRKIKCVTNQLYIFIHKRVPVVILSAL